MAALAYVLLPISGMMVFFSQGSDRVRFHGAQAVAFGLVWPLVLYGCTAVSSTATQITFALGVIVWLVLIATAATGRDLRLPLLGPLCARAVGEEGAR